MLGNKKIIFCSDMFILIEVRLSIYKEDDDYEEDMMFIDLMTRKSKIVASDYVCVSRK